MIARFEELLHEVADALCSLSLHCLLIVGVHIDVILAVSVYHAYPVTVGLALVVYALQHEFLHLLQHQF